MPSTNLTGKTKADLVVLAELSGLLTAAAARRKTKAQLLEFLKEAEQKPNSETAKQKSESTDAKTAATADDLPAKKTTSRAKTAGTKASGTKASGTRKTTARKTAGTKSAADVSKSEDSETAVDDKDKTNAKTAATRRKTTSRTRKTTKKDEENPQGTPAPASKPARGRKPKTKPEEVTEEKTVPARNTTRRRKLAEKTTDKTTEAAGAAKENKDEKQLETQTKQQNSQNNQSTHKQIGQQNQNSQKANGQTGNKQRRPLVEQGEPVAGILEIMSDGYGFLRKDNYLQGNKDIYVPPQYIRRFNLRTGDYVTGPGKLQRENDRYQALLYVKEVNGMPPDKMIRRPQFDRLTPVYPDERYRLETTRNELSTRIIDLAAPIGKGQRGMIVSPPKAGKTILLQKIANAISINNPDVKLIVLLIDERPEEVTDMQRSIKGEVVYSTFDKTPENHVKVTELVLERAMRLVELKQDVVILLDSMTRLGRAYNLTINPTGRTLSGGLDPGALYGPKRFFGAARNIENGGSLTIISTSLIETGSRMDEVIFEEFKGTGNMEVYLDRKLSEKRIFPAIDINRSGTRREELLMTETELDAVWTIRKAFSQLDTAAVTETIINLLLKTQNNEHFISSINVSFNDKSIFEAMRGNRPAGNGQGQNNNNGSGR